VACRQWEIDKFKPAIEIKTLERTVQFPVPVHEAFQRLGYPLAELTLSFAIKPAGFI
jgi:hypothetical protein